MDEMSNVKHRPQMTCSRFDLRISKAACGVVRNFYFRRCGWGQVGISKVECRVVRNFAISKVQGRRKGNFVFSACPVLG